MYLKFTIDGDLEKLVKTVWFNITEGDIDYDYENRYEWVWLKLPEFSIRLNISREHEWEKNNTIYPIYISAFEIEEDKYVDEIPEKIIEYIHKNINCKIKLFKGRYYVDVEENEPIRILE